MSGRADARTARELAQWRRQSERLALLLRAEPSRTAIKGQAFALQRQCERRAADLRHLGTAGHERPVVPVTHREA
jgi:hypothetical protein